MELHDEEPEEDVEEEKLRVAEYFAEEPNPNCVLAVRVMKQLLHAIY